MSVLSPDALRWCFLAAALRGVESVARWHGGRCQPNLASALKLASARHTHTHTPQPQEFSVHPLPWQSRHSQTG